MATIGTLNLSNPKLLINSSKFPQAIKLSSASPLGLTGSGGMRKFRAVRAAPDKISEKVEESIKNAQETCAGDPTSGECVAAWDEVEELSAAASHARDKKKDSDPLEDYCKDNPETLECKTFDD
ncbi:calvin cycle protein CP12-2, chloroplastic-like [Cicer arietinum]|uniref:Calvin cycle protein CP12-2, chloroplastic-like n=1 Tax=Cicer arietinum TaxID=3827 RepID=A0A1S2XTR8_CICAR|nr:calvin cycle protein CP12-2, chloroplastic-like [Cicer arietinum]